MKKSNNNTIIKPFNASSAFTVFICLIFPVVTVALTILSIKNGFEVRNWLGIAIGAILSFVIDKPLITNLFNSKIEIKEHSFVIHYYENLKTFNKDNPLKFPKMKSVEINYKDLSKYGAFKSNELRNDGRDEKQRKVVVFVSNGTPIPFVMPKMVDNIQKMLIFNYKDGESVTIDKRYYSKKQTEKLFALLKQKSGKDAICNVSTDNDGYKRFLFVGSLFVLLAAAPTGLVMLARFLRPTTETANTPFEYIYGIGSMLFVVAIYGVFACKTDDNTKHSKTEINELGKKCLIAAIVTGIATVVSFVLENFV